MHEIPNIITERVDDIPLLRETNAADGAADRWI